MCITFRVQNSRAEAHITWSTAHRPVNGNLNPRILTLLHPNIGPALNIKKNILSHKCIDSTGQKAAHTDIFCATFLQEEHISTHSNTSHHDFYKTEYKGKDAIIWQWNVQKLFFLEVLSFSNAVNHFSARHAAVLRRPIEALYLDRFAVDPAVNFRQAPKWLEAH